MSEAEKIRISVLDMALADADDAEVNASDFRRAADEFESAQPEIAKRYREAAHRQAESAAWLRGERQGAAPADVEPTPPMTIERACDVLNEHEAGGARWAADQGWVESRLSLASGAPVSTYWPESLVLAVANQLLRDAASAPAKEVG